MHDTIRERSAFLPRPFSAVINWNQVQAAALVTAVEQNFLRVGVSDAKANVATQSKAAPARARFPQANADPRWSQCDQGPKFEGSQAALGCAHVAQDAAEISAQRSSGH